MALVPQHEFDQMVEHVESSYPFEACGILLGVWSEQEPRIVAVRRVYNISRHRTEDHFELSPRDYLVIDREAQRIGLDFVGVYHSHPDHPAFPSKTDFASAIQAWDDSDSWLYPILSVRGGAFAHCRCWQLHKGRFLEHPLHVVEPPRNFE